MRVILLRPPRYVWPFNSETSAFWQPLGLLCLAAAVRRDIPGVRIEVWDCPAERCGWKSLQRRLAAERIDVLGFGEETVSAHEAFRAGHLVRQLHPQCIIIAGGTYFAHAIPQSLATGAVDVIVRGEGELTLVELLQHIDDRSAWPDIRGIAFSDPSGEVVTTPPRPLVADLDSLPLPAFDLIDMNRYGRGSHNHPDLVSIEHSRGCIDSCSFCILWKHMGQSVDGNGTFRPHLRTKSAQRSFEEVRWLHDQFGRRTFGWVDPTFNASPQWSDKWADLMLASDLCGPRGRCRTLHTAWVRADCLLRDHKLGILDKLVRAGLRQVMIGVERDRDEDLASLGKHGHSDQVCREAFAVLREHYPQVYSIGSMIFGLPDDTEADLRRLARYQYEIGIDYCFFIPFTPNPGSEMTEAMASSGRIANGEAASYNFHTPVCRTDHLDLRQLEALYWRLIFTPDWRRVRDAMRQFFFERDSRKRRIHRALMSKGMDIAVRALARRILHPVSPQPTIFSRRPSWYDE